MKRILISASLAICLVFALCSCNDYIANTTSTDHILSIGLSYKNTAVSELRGTLNDALEVGAALESILNEKTVPRRLMYMLQEDLSVDDKESKYYPSRDHILQAVESMSTNPSDLITLFYSGHGQNIYWGKCPKCGYEFNEFASEEGNPGHLSCPDCADSIELLTILSQSMASSSSPASSAAAQYLEHSISKEAYIEALLNDGSSYAKEILGLADYMYETVPEVTLKDRAFFVTAPADAVDFQVWLEDYAVQDGISGWLLTMMKSDYYLPHAANYFTDPSGYYAALYIRVEMYGANTGVRATFTRLWNMYLNSCWMNTNWTKLYMDELVDVLEAKNCKSILIADCCYSGHIVVGRDDEVVSFGKGFVSMFSASDHRKVTTVAASTPEQTSLDSLVATEEGQYEHHGLFTISFLKQIGWAHSSTHTTYEVVCGEARPIDGYEKSVPLRSSMGLILTGILDTWSYQRQSPQINTTYLNTVLIP